MKLLSKEHAQNKIRKDNETLVEQNIRLRELWNNINSKLNSIKDNYSQDKINKLNEFENFCKDLALKKSKLLEEYAGIEKLIEHKKELYYKLVEKQDALEEQKHAILEREQKVELREKYVDELEAKQRALIN